MYFGVKVEPNRVIYIDDICQDYPADPPKLDQFRFFATAQEADEVFSNAVAKMKEPPQYYYLYTAERAVWIVAAKEPPIAFKGPYKTFRSARCAANGMRLIGPTIRHSIVMDEKEQREFDEFWQNP